jgi:hypothetical protein
MEMYEGKFIVASFLKIYLTPVILKLDEMFTQFPFRKKHRQCSDQILVNTSVILDLRRLHDVIQSEADAYVNVLPDLLPLLLQKYVFPLIFLSRSLTT